MTNDNNVVFKGTKDGIIILLDEEADFGLIRQTLLKKAMESKKFFENASTSITFKGRELSPFEERELIRIITMGSGLNVASVVNDTTALAPEDEAFDNIMQMPPIHPHSGRLPFSAARNDTIYHRGSIRSGQAVKHNGSVVVIGDVNPGGEITAEGNIIILGSLKGIAHAGCKGNRECFVAALNLVPSQLRIGDIITSIAEEFNKKKVSKTVPSYAYIHQGQIYIAPLV